MADSMKNVEHNAKHIRMLRK